MWFIAQFGWGSGYVQFEKCHNIGQIHRLTLTDSDDVLLSDEDFPILFLSFVDFFLHTFSVITDGCKDSFS